MRKEPLEQFVVKTALEKVLNDRVIDLLADKLLEYQSQENTRLPVLQAELKEVKRRIDNLVAAIEQGILTPSTKSRMEELEQQLAGTMEQLAAMRQDLQEMQKSPAEISPTKNRPRIGGKGGGPPGTDRRSEREHH